MSKYPTDESLMAAAANGNRRAQRLVADRLACVPRMVRLRRKQLGAALDGREDDLVQDVVLAVWDRLDRFRGGASLEAWVWGFVLRISYRRIERVQRRPKQAPIDDHEYLASAPDPDRVVLQERHAQVHAALGELDTVTRGIVSRRHFEAQAFEAIGEELNLPMNTVKTRYYRGLKALGTKLRQHAQEG